MAIKILGAACILWGLSILSAWWDRRILAGRKAEKDLRAYQAFLGGQLAGRSIEKWREWKIQARGHDQLYRRYVGKLEAGESCEFFTDLMLKGLRDEEWLSRTGATERRRVRP